MKKLFSLILAGLMTLSLAACGGSGGSAQASKDNKVLYHVYNTAPYVTLDPSTEYSNGVMVLQNVYETLTRYNPETGGLDPLLATEWKENKDGTVWTFQLRDDVNFHDGTHMTAQQVVNSFRRSMDLGQGGAYIWDAVLESNGGKVEATGEYEVTITCGYPCAIDLIVSAGYAAYVMSDSVIEQPTEWFNEGHDGGTGPYTIAQATGDSVVLKAYEDYRGGWQDNQYKNVMIKEVAESSARRQMMETGEAQLSSEFSATDLDALKAQTDKVYTYQSETFNNIIMFLNTATEPCSNADFRRALAYAFPYEETVSQILNGNAKQSVGTVPSGLWGHDDGILQYHCDLDKAKEYTVLWDLFIKDQIAK